MDEEIERARLRAGPLRHQGRHRHLVRGPHRAEPVHRLRWPHARVAPPAGGALPAAAEASGVRAPDHQHREAAGHPRAGIVDFSVTRNPRVSTDESDGCFEPCGASRSPARPLGRRCWWMPATRRSTSIEMRLPLCQPAPPRHGEGIRESTDGRRAGVVPSRRHRHDRGTLAVGDRHGWRSQRRHRRHRGPDRREPGRQFHVARDRWAGVWAKEVLRQLRDTTPRPTPANG